MKKREMMIMILILSKTLFAVCHNRHDIKYLKLKNNFCEFSFLARSARTKLKMTMSEQ